MIDIHCHLLPGRDDGAQTLEEAVEMARIAFQDGITDMIVTPHTYDGIYHNTPEETVESMGILQKELERHHIPIRLHPGAEVHIHFELYKHLMNKQIMTLCDQEKYLLLELPSLTLPLFTDILIDELLQNGIIPIIAHPERIVALRHQQDRLVGWIKKGAIAQITGDSLTGKMGKRTKQFAHKLVRQRLVHLVASDAHRVRYRRAELSEAFTVLSELLPEEDVTRFHYNAQAILHAEPCKVWEIGFVTRKKWWFW
ncbi:tyrosine-protein phosphatase [Brevibacillus ginsengisoli]|uniref:tyrosine-protein phosphatase n=1 Tax=Brevibacillus ginsengisoli TaxID=363854 RepID=UPI003CF210BC